MDLSSFVRAGEPIVDDGDGAPGSLPDALSPADFARQIAFIRDGLEDMSAWMAATRRDLDNMEAGRDRAYACVAECRVEIERLVRERDSYAARLGAALLLLDRKGAEPIVSERRHSSPPASEHRSPASTSAGG